jgi:hypothetical protein
MKSRRSQGGTSSGLSDFSGGCSASFVSDITLFFFAFRCAFRSALDSDGNVGSLRIFMPNFPTAWAAIDCFLRPRPESSRVSPSSNSLPERLCLLGDVEGGISSSSSRSPRPAFSFGDMFIEFCSIAAVPSSFRAPSLCKTLLKSSSMMLSVRHLNTSASFQYGLILSYPSATKKS